MRKQSKLVIFGAGGHGHVVADIAVSLGYEDISFVDENPEHLSRKPSWPVLGSTLSDSSKLSHVVVAIGNNVSRLAKVRQFLAEGYHLPPLIHASAYVSNQAKLAAGTVVMPKAVVNARTQLGLAVIVNTSSSIDHDCQIADGVHVCPGTHIAGGVTIGRHSQIGLGSVIRERITVGDDVLVAAGAAVVANVPNATMVAGVPAKPKAI